MHLYVFLILKAFQGDLYNRFVDENGISINTRDKTNKTNTMLLL